MNKQRPVNLDLFSFHFPITAITSGTHRITGVLLAIGIPLLLWLLSLTLKSESGFNEASQFISAGFGKVLFWAVLSALAYHIIAGIRHLLMDIGIGESLEGGILGAKLIIVFSALSAIGLGVWLW